MFEQISKLVSALQDAGALKHGEVISALAAFAPCVEDPDYRSRLMGELSLRLGMLGDFDRAEHFARSVTNTEKSEFLRQVADLESKKNEHDRASRLLLEAREAAVLHRFPTQQAQALMEIASSFEAAARKDDALDTWDLAVELAKKAQHRGGTDGPEAAGVLVRAVEAFCKAGKTGAAKSTAEEIVFPQLREKALRAIVEI